MSYEPSAFDLAAAVVRRAGDPNELLGYLATKFQAALPGQVRVERGGFLGRGPVRLVDVALGDYRYGMEIQRNMLQARRAKTVRGVEIAHRGPDHRPLGAGLRGGSWRRWPSGANSTARLLGVWR